MRSMVDSNTSSETWALSGGLRLSENRYWRQFVPRLIASASLNAPFRSSDAKPRSSCSRTCSLSSMFMRCAARFAPPLRCEPLKIMAVLPRRRTSGRAPRAGGHERCAHRAAPPGVRPRYRGRAAARRHGRAAPAGSGCSTASHCRAGPGLARALSGRGIAQHLRLDIRAERRAPGFADKAFPLFRVQPKAERCGPRTTRRRCRTVRRSRVEGAA